MDELIHPHLLESDGDRAIIYSVRACISHYVLLLCQQDGVSRVHDIVYRI